MNKWLSIQALRGIAVLCVVAFHLMPIERKYLGGNFLPDFFRLGQSGVDLFFVISGFVMVAITRRRFSSGGGGESARFAWGRLTRIYPTYWFYFLLTVAIFLIKPNWVNATQGNQAHLLSSFFLLPSDRLPLVMVAWSLIHELWFYLVFAFLLNFRKTLLLRSLLIWAAIVVVVNCFFSPAEMMPAARIAVHPHSIEFILGALVAIFVNGGKSAGLPPSIPWLVLAIVAVVGLPLAYFFDILKDDGLVRAGGFGVLYGLVVLSFALLEKQGRFMFPRALTFVGDMSYTIYLSHVLVLSAIGRLWMMAGPTTGSLWSNTVILLIMLTVVIGYGWIGYCFIEQPLLRLSHALRERWFKAKTAFSS